MYHQSTIIQNKCSYLLVNGVGDQSKRRVITLIANLKVLMRIINEELMVLFFFCSKGSAAVLF